MFRRIAYIIIDHIFPRICIGCRRVEGTVLCKQCLGSISVNDVQRCPVCTRRDTLGGGRCARCARSSPLDYLIVATEKNAVVRKLVHFFKYRFVTELELPLSGLMLQAFLKEVITNDRLALVPVPLHPSQVRWRGFNQSQLLARSVGSCMDVAVLSRILVRIRKTKSQMKLARARRLHNIMDAFICARPVPHHTEFVLIDDIATTRATLEECARTLKANGAWRVGALVISRGT